MPPALGAVDTESDAPAANAAGGGDWEMKGGKHSLRTQHTDPHAEYDSFCEHKWLVLREIELHEVGYGMCYIAIASLLRIHPGWLSHTPKNGLNKGVSRMKRLNLVQRSRESQIKEDQLLHTSSCACNCLQGLSPETSRPLQWAYASCARHRPAPAVRVVWP